MFSYKSNRIKLFVNLPSSPQYVPNVFTPATYPEMNPFINQDFDSPNLQFKPSIPAKMETIEAMKYEKLITSAT